MIRIFLTIYLFSLIMDVSYQMIIQDLKKAYGVLFVSNEGTISDRIKEVSEDFSGNVPVMEIVDFLTKEKSRSICKPKNVS